ncbi:MAG: hypothetical protein R3Y08_06410 [Rikenellaceae bacterium]
MNLTDVAVAAVNSFAQLLDLYNFLNARGIQAQIEVNLADVVVATEG